LTVRKINQHLTKIENYMFDLRHRWSRSITAVKYLGILNTIE
jgi:hypothetical protein